MPLSVEAPAPPKKTILSAPSISACSAAILPCSMGHTPSGPKFLFIISRSALCERKKSRADPAPAKKSSALLCLQK